MYAAWRAPRLLAGLAAPQDPTAVADEADGR
jgi:hypothetical protein